MHLFINLVYMKDIEVYIYILVKDTPIISTYLKLLLTLFFAYLNILQGKYLKTLIKAAGLWYPKVNSNTTSTFRVDRSKHLVSVVSMFGKFKAFILF